MMIKNTIESGGGQPHSSMAFMLLISLFSLVLPSSSVAANNKPSSMAAWEHSIVTVEVARKQYDYYQPWSKRTRRLQKAGVVAVPRRPSRRHAQVRQERLTTDWSSKFAPERGQGSVLRNVRQPAANGTSIWAESTTALTAASIALSVKRFAPATDELIAAGVPREDIVLGFHPADVRPLTGFAVG